MVTVVGALGFRPFRKKYWNWKLIFAGVVVLAIVGEFISDAEHMGYIRYSPNNCG
jgi:hypothetical protein